MPKNFFLSDAHLGMDVAEYGGLMEPAMRMRRALQAVSAAQEPGAFVLPDFHVLLGRAELLLADLRAHVGGFVQPISNLYIPHTIEQPIDELRINAFLHNDAAGSRATLTGSSKGAPDGAIDREIEIGIIQNDHCVLAAHLQRAVLEGSRCSFTHQSAHFARACERDR